MSQPAKEIVARLRRREEQAQPQSQPHPQPLSQPPSRSQPPPQKPKSQPPARERALETNSLTRLARDHGLSQEDQKGFLVPSHTPGLVGTVEDVAGAECRQDLNRAESIVGGRGASQPALGDALPGELALPNGGKGSAISALSSAAAAGETAQEEASRRKKRRLEWGKTQVNGSSSNGSTASKRARFDLREVRELHDVSAEEMLARAEQLFEASDRLRQNNELNDADILLVMSQLRRLQYSALCFSEGKRDLSARELVAVKTALEKQGNDWASSPRDPKSDTHRRLLVYCYEAAAVAQQRWLVVHHSSVKELRQIFLDMKQHQNPAISSKMLGVADQLVLSHDFAYRADLFGGRMQLREECVTSSVHAIARILLPKLVLLLSPRLQAAVR